MKHGARVLAVTLVVAMTATLGAVAGNATAAERTVTGRERDNKPVHIRHPMPSKRHHHALRAKGKRHHWKARHRRRHDPPLCGTRVNPPHTYDHIIWIWFENRSYGDIVGPRRSSAARNAPYINNTLIPQCGLATNFHNETHPSLPNYLAATSGSTHGITTNCDPSRCSQPGPSLFSQVAKRGQWRSYEESMPKNCYLHSTNLYSVHHNPAAYYKAIRSQCDRWDIPMGTTSRGAFFSDLRKNTLPAFSFVTPNQCHNMHDCSIKQGDDFLRDWIPIITSSRAYQSGNTAVFITWDEGRGGANGIVCGFHPSNQSCHIPTLVISPYTRPGTRSSTSFNHYSLLKTTEQMLGINNFLGHAAFARTKSMRPAFNL